MIGLVKEGGIAGVGEGCFGFICLWSMGVERVMEDSSIRVTIQKGRSSGSAFVRWKEGHGMVV